MSMCMLVASTSLLAVSTAMLVVSSPSADAARDEDAGDRHARHQHLHARRED